VLELLESWIDDVNNSHLAWRRSCSRFQPQFSGFYSSSLLNASYYVIVDTLPLPGLPELRQVGLGDFIDNQNRFDGITYKDTYYLLPKVAGDASIHFHELVHVIQWRELGARAFIQRYMAEIQMFGYGRQAPLEGMAFGLQDHFDKGAKPFDVEQKVLKTL
jgi:hypothetical protein